MKRILPLLLILFPLVVVADDPAGKVLLSIGNNQAINQQGESRPLVRTSLFFTGDTLVTDITGRLQLRMSDGALVAMNPDSRFRVADYVFADAEGDRAIFELVRGGMRTLSGKIGPDSGGEYEVRTVVATIGIRGTHYALQLCLEGCAGEAGRREGLAGLVLDGRILVTSAAGEKEVPSGRYFFVDRLSGEISTGDQPSAELVFLNAGPQGGGLPLENLFDPATRPALERLPSGGGKLINTVPGTGAGQVPPDTDTGTTPPGTDTGTAPPGTDTDTTPPGGDTGGLPGDGDDDPGAT